jgi:hypothetical protein
MNGKSNMIKMVYHASLLSSSIKQVNCVGGMAGIEPTPSKSNDWTPLSPCQLGQGGGDKDGITIEDALPMIRLSTTKNDKHVFGVLGDPKRQNSRQELELLIVNSLGEGGIWVCNSNGNIENGDYVT